MKTSDESTEIQSQNGLPAHCIWRIMRKVTKRHVSSQAVREMERSIISLIEESTRRADGLLNDWNNQLPEKLRRKRITMDVIKRVINDI